MPGSNTNEAPAEIDPSITGLEHSGRSRPDVDTVLALLDSLERAEITEIDQLARFHDALLFLRAYPQNPRVLKKADALLNRFAKPVRFIARTQDIEPLFHPDVSGIAGTSIRGIFTWDMVNWLADRFPDRVSIDWESHDDSDRLAPILAGMLPLLEEMSVDANVTWLEWIEAAGVMKKDRGLNWLLRGLNRLQIDDAARAALFDSLQIWILWQLDDTPVTRTRMRRPFQPVFYQAEPLLSRYDVSLAEELEGDDLEVRRLTRIEGETALEMARGALAIRYREVYGFTYGDPGAVLSVQAGRGLEILITGIQAAKRLPIRAGFGALLLRNGVPIGYGDAYGLGDRLEVSFNIFYSFRDGESAFCWARMLKLYNQIFGSTSFSVDPYQIGLGNEEAIESGAFWFHRKLGFRASDPEVERLAQREESRIARNRAYRTSARTLRRMAQSALIYDVVGAPPGEWDHFHIGNIGLAVQRDMAKSGLNASEFRQACLDKTVTALSLDPTSLSKRELHALEGFAPVLALIRDLPRWTVDEREGVISILRAKAGRHEEKVLRLLTEHTRLTSAVRRLGRKRDKVGSQRSS